MKEDIATIDKTSGYVKVTFRKQKRSRKIKKPREEIKIQWTFGNKKLRKQPECRPKSN